MVIAQALGERGIPVVLGGDGPHRRYLQEAGYSVRHVATMPQERMDRFVERGEYGFYDAAWVDRCVRSERKLIRSLRPGLVVHDMRPTAAISARLEGVDDARVTQAYNQPGYPLSIPLPLSFSTEAGPFEAYLRERSREARSTRTFWLLADIPELHPPGSGAPGYHYVGPLLASPVEPSRVEILDEGWDLSLPLIYLTTGSSGRYPEYLAPLLAAATAGPFRWLVTTSGRWTGSVSSDRVRVVPFLPGDWILRRASALVGVPGIGAIYQAFKAGVPVIGAPEHLDQEYHLDRVEALGLGIKLDRRRLEPEVILGAVAEVTASTAAYRSRCRTFAGHVAKWEGGRVAAALIESHLHRRGLPYRIETGFLVREREFVPYLAACTPDSLTEPAIRRMLERNLTREIPHRRRDGEVWFDRVDSWNWLYDHEPEFFEADYRACEARRAAFLESDGAGWRCRTPWQRYRMRYSLRLDTRALSPGQRLKLFLPHPITRPRVQEPVRLVRTEPADLQVALAESLGFLYGYTFAADPAAPVREFSYETELTVREQRWPDPVLEPRSDEGGPRAQDLAVDPGLADRPEVRCFLAGLDLPAEVADETRARAIYQALAGSKRLRRTRDHSQGQTYCAVAVLTENGGHCITLSRAFAALCRLGGIPTREVAGALLGYPAGQGRYVARSLGEPLFGHTWTEIYLQSRGWVPVEFHGIATAAHALTGENVADPSIHRQILSRSQSYLDYYFGSVDPMRVRCSSSAMEIPEFLVERPAYPPGDRRRWQWSEEVGFSCALEVECL
ncbi:MAG: transglutaminase domain-containing protein [Candidatus Latescibacterota bacterium]|jgi:UDP:flavonoid glycosyltransferase YjiC (YdhE family)